MLNTNAKTLINSNGLKPCVTGQSQLHTQTLKAWAEKLFCAYNTKRNHKSKRL